MTSLQADPQADTANTGPVPASGPQRGFDIDSRLGRLALLDQARSTGRAVLIPLAAALVALAVGAVLIAIEGENPFAVYGQVVRGVWVERNGLRDTLTTATPLILMGVGLSLAYRARVFTIGAEGQFVIGATAATAVVTVPALQSWPAAVVIGAGIVVGAAAGALWSGVCGVLQARFGASVVITSLLLNYVAIAIMGWAVRVGIRDPKGFIPQSRVVGVAELTALPSLGVHRGFLATIVVVPAAALLLARTRLGFRVDVLGHNPHALAAQETGRARFTVIVLAMCGALAGLAGFIETAGVNSRLRPATAAGLGFTAIIVALLGRLHPVGVFAAAIGLAALQIGFDTAERSYSLPSSLVGVIQALVVLLVVAGDGLAGRRAGRG